MLTKRLVEDILSKRNYKWIEHGLRHSKGRKLLHFKSPLIKKYIKYTGQYNSNRELPLSFLWRKLLLPISCTTFQKQICVHLCMYILPLQPFVIKWQHTHCSEPCFSLSHMPWRSFHMNTYKFIHLISQIDHNLLFSY